MPGKILGLDISRDSITAVQVTSGLKGYQITSCFRIMIEEDGGLDNALKELSQKMDLKSDTYLASIPGGDVSYRNLQMPFKEPKKIRQTIPYEIETVVPFPIDDIVVDFDIIDRPDQSEVLAVSVKKTYISEYLSKLQTFGIDPDILDISPVPIVAWLLDQGSTPSNGLFLDIGPNRNSLVLFLKKRIVLIRNLDTDNGAISLPIPHNMNNYGQDNPTPEQIESCLKSICVKAQNTIHSFGWQTKREIILEKTYFTGIGSLYPGMGEFLSRFLGTPVERINISGDKRVHMDNNIARVWNPALMDSGLALVLRDIKKSHGFNLRKGDFELRKRYLGLKKNIRKAAVLLILIFLFLSFDLGVDYYFLKKRYDTAHQRVTEMFRQVFPETKMVKYPVHQMKVKIDEIKKSAILLPRGIRTDQKVLDLLRDISQRIPKSLDIDATSLVIDPESVRIIGETDTFNTVDNLKNGLEPSVYFNTVTTSSANRDRTGKRVKFEIKLQRAK
ncbi:pilus assembly protein PilM [Thermodesulfobacteriota bacterium]